MSVQDRLNELGLVLPPAPKPIAAYVPVVRTGNLLVLSGQLPLRNGELVATGPVPSKVTVELAQEAAAQCVLNALAIAADALDGNLNRIKQVVRVGAFVLSDNGFGDQAKVVNGASELLEKLLGAAGKHARASIGVNALPLSASVEIEFIFEVE